MDLSLGFSTCPNDTFIFEAIISGRVDTEGLTFSPYLADVEDLNRKALVAELDVTKLSYFAYGYVSKNYLVLDSGSALGQKNGPLLLSRSRIYPDEVADLRIAIPGRYTTANLLLDIVYPKVREKKEYLFSDIEDVVLSGEMDAGLAIHENRFTYKKRGLFKILDLGDYWEELSGMPIPLGGIVIRRSLPADMIKKVNRVLERSVAYALTHPATVMPYVKKYAREMDEDVLQKHIHLYVNDYTRNLGENGKKAIQTLFEIASERQVIPELHPRLFVSDLEEGDRNQ